MKKFLASLVAIALLSLVPATALATPAHPLSASLYPIPPAPPSTPAAAAHASAKDAASDLAGLTPAALAAKGSIQLPAVASGPGTISIVLKITTHGKSVVIGSGRATVSAAGAVQVTLKLGHAGKSALKGHKNPKVTVAVVFSPQHGPKKTANLKVALK